MEVLWLDKCASEFPQSGLYATIRVMWKLCCTAFGVAVLAAPGVAHAQHAPLVVELKASHGYSVGTVTFRETMGGKLNIHIELINMPPGKHAVHIHENPVCDAPDFKTSGAHFNPDGRQHGTENPLGHHRGDLPENIFVDDSRTGEASITVDYLSVVKDAPDSILGTSIIIHELADDMKTDPTGNSGNRIACGVITEPALQP